MMIMDLRCVIIFSLLAVILMLTRQHRQGLFVPPVPAIAHQILKPGLEELPIYDDNRP